MRFSLNLSFRYAVGSFRSLYSRARAVSTDFPFPRCEKLKTSFIIVNSVRKGWPGFPYVSFRAVILIGNRPRGTSVLRYCKLVNRVRILGKLCRPLFITGLDDTRPMINDITVPVPRCFVENYRMWIIAKLRNANDFIPSSKLHSSMRLSRREKLRICEKREREREIDSKEILDTSIAINYQRSEGSNGSSSFDGGWTMFQDSLELDTLKLELDRIW